MGAGHFTPSGTRQRHTEIADYRTQHISTTDRSDDRMEQEHRELVVLNTLCREHGFKQIEPTWIHNGVGEDEKVIAETSHGVELRVKYHPHGSKYYNLVATTGEFNRENLAIQHLRTYKNTLRQAISDVYGSVYTQTGNWTSRKVESQ